MNLGQIPRRYGRSPKRRGAPQNAQTVRQDGPDLTGARYVVGAGPNRAFYTQPLNPLPSDPERPETLDTLIAHCLEPNPNDRVREISWVKERMSHIADWVQAGHGRIDQAHERHAQWVVQAATQRATLAAEIKQLERQRTDERAKLQPLETDYEALSASVESLRAELTTQSTKHAEIRAADGSTLVTTLPDTPDRPALVRIPSGTFRMGNPKEQGDEDEHPSHEARIATAFWMSNTLITQSNYQHLMGHNPARFNEERGGGRRSPR